MSYPITSSDLDTFGGQPLLDDIILDLHFVNLSGSPFWSPNETYTGYAADGYWYDLGIRNESLRASWAEESTSLHRGPSNELPQTFYIVLSERGVQQLDAGDLSLIARSTRTYLEGYTGESEPGIFLEWEADDSLAEAGSGIGSAASTLSLARWVGGRLFVATSQGLRVLDFKQDRAWCLLDLGNYEPRFEELSGLANRNRSDYFSSTLLYTPSGMTAATCLAAKRVSDTDYIAVSDGSVLRVLAWGESLTHTESSIDNILELQIDSQSRLWGLRLNESNRLEVFTSDSEWRGGSIAASFKATLPSLAGQVGYLALRGDQIFVGARSGVWLVTADDLSVTHLYGSTVAVAGDDTPAYVALSNNGQSIQDVAIDPSTGYLGVLHGDLLEVIDTTVNQVVSSYTLATSPALPVGSSKLIGFGIRVAEAL